MKKKKKCPQCSGEGRKIILYNLPSDTFSKTKMVACQACNGTGKV